MESNFHQQPTVAAVVRAFELIDALAARGGQAMLAELATDTRLPGPTAHRLVRTLVQRGVLWQLPSRQYALGPRLVPLGEMATGMVGAWARPVLDRLASVVGESANLAVLDADGALYVGHAPSRHAMRMFTEVGHRAPLHSTGVGKAMLSRLADDRVALVVERAGLGSRTARTITSATRLADELARIRERGYALDDGEEEDGVFCIAVPVVAAALPIAAVSVSAPQGRLAGTDVERVVPLLVDAARALADNVGAAL